MQRRTTSTSHHLHPPFRPSSPAASTSSRTSSIPHRAASTSGASAAAARTGATPRPEALWATMQHALAEVEACNASVFFGAPHARALDDLRAAQIALAQAWMVDAGAEEAAGPDAAAESEHDVLLARKRRAVSDAHFARVAAGVHDVAAKLDRVARAMSRAETESRGVWGDESVLFGSDSSMRGGGGGGGGELGAGGA